MKDKKDKKGYTPKSVLFEVTNTWKGIQQSQVIITTGQGGGDCGIDFKVGQDYLVYAHESTMYGENTLVTVICDRTNKLSSLQQDLEVLGEGEPPSEIVDLSNENGGNQMYIWIPVFIAFGIVAIILIKRRKKFNG
ncbi:hypothetical protein ACFYKT_21150 [Cytobacillus sp. FJAT-53684]|uniref:CbiN domain protein n=1 Tax=Cytobacillus mangrovibacter TaxID=3299024 RepID=A0ABW6K663_9BACI